MEENAKAKTGKQSLLRRILRWLAWIIGSLLVLLLALQLIFYFYSDAIVGSVLKGVVSSQSDGLYVLEYDTIRFDLANKRLNFKGLSIEADSGKWEQLKAQGKEPKNRVSVRVPEIDIVDRGFSRFYFTDHLKLKHIHIERPEVVLYTSSEHKEGKHYDLLRVPGLYPVISGYFDDVAVGDFQLNQGTLHVLSKGDSALDLRLQNITVEIDSIFIDSTNATTDDYPFTFGTFEANIRNNRLQFPGTDHHLEVDQFWLSGTNRRIELLDAAWVHPGGEAAHNAFRVPKAVFEGVEFERLYFDRDLRIEDVEIEKLGANVHLGKPGVVVPDSASKSLYESVENYLRSVEVKTLLSNNGSLKLINHNHSNPVRYDFEKLIVLIQGFQLDSATQEERKPYLYSDDVDVVINDYSINLPDSIHRLEAEQLGISTSRNEVYGKQVGVRPRISKKRFAQLRQFHKNLFTLDIPEFKATGVDLWQVYYDRLIDLDELFVEDPDVQVLHHPELADKPDRLDVRNLFPLIDGRYSSVAADRFNLSNGRVRFKSLGESKVREMDMRGINVDLRQFLLNKSSYADRSRLLYSRSFNTSTREASVLLADSLHQLRLENLKANSRRGNLFADRFHLAPLEEVLNDTNRTDTTGTLVLDLEALRMEDFDYNKAYFDQDFQVRLMRFTNPDVAVHSVKPQIQPRKLSDLFGEHLKVPLVNRYVSNLAIEDLEVDSGKIELYSDLKDTAAGLTAEGLYVCLQDLVVDTALLRRNELLFDARDLDFRAGRYTVLLDKRRHRLIFKDFLASQESNLIQAERVLLEPVAKYRMLGKNNIVELDMPGMKVEGIDLRKAYRDRIVEVERLKMHKPEVSMLLQKRERKGFKRNQGQVLDSLYQRILDGAFQSVALDSLSVDSGSIDLVRYSKESLSSTAMRDISVEARNFYIDSAAVSDSSHFFYSDDIEIKLSDYRNLLADSTHVLEIDSLVMSTERSEMVGKNLHLHPLPKPDSLRMFDPDTLESNLVDVHLPSFRVSGVNLPNAVRRTELVVDSLTLESPVVQVHQLKEPNPEDPRLTADSVKALLGRYFGEYRIGKLRVRNGYVDIAGGENQECLPDLDLDVTNFIWDSTTVRDPERPLFADDVSATMHGYQAQTKDAKFTLDFGEIGFSTDSNRLFVNDFKVTPYRDKFNFAQRYQSDWIKLDNGRIQLDDLDFDGLFYDRRIRASRLLVDSMHIEVFRDKRLRFPEDQRPVLPTHFIRDMDTYVWIDSIQLRRSYAKYEEFAPRASEPGYLFFDSLRVNGYNLTNDTALTNKGVPFQLRASALLMGEGELKASFSFDMASPKGDYSYTGSLGAMDMTALNPMLEHVAFARIKRGEASRLRLNVRANDSLAYGQMRFYYRHLKIRLLNKSDTGNVKRIQSIMVNGFVINTANPKFIFPRNGEIFFKRDQARSIFHYWAYTAFSGLKSSVVRKVIFREPGAKDKLLDGIGRWRSQVSWDDEL